MASTLVSASTLITSALDLIGAFAVGDSVSGADMADSLRRLNAMMGQWATQTLTIPVQARETFAISSGVGEYTIGDGATWDTSRPVKITGAGLVLGGSSPAVEIPIALLTDDGWQAVQSKALTSSQWTSLYYSPTFVTSGYGTVQLWPVPTDAANTAVIYRKAQIAEFADATTEYQLPPGYQEALEYNLAMRLAAPYGRALRPEVMSLATKSLAQIKRTNVKLAPLRNDASGLFRESRSYGYNAETGNM